VKTRRGDNSSTNLEDKQSPEGNGELPSILDRTLCGRKMDDPKDFFHEMEVSSTAEFPAS